MISAFHFPLDLERIIFEQAAFRNHQTALQLIRVSKSVCHWFVDHRATSCEADYGVTGSNRRFTNISPLPKHSIF